MSSKRLGILDRHGRTHRCQPRLSCPPVDKPSEGGGGGGRVLSGVERDPTSTARAEPVSSSPWRFQRFGLRADRRVGRRCPAPARRWMKVDQRPRGATSGPRQVTGRQPDPRRHAGRPLSCFDPVRREVARLTLEELVLDGRSLPRGSIKVREVQSRDREGVCTTGEDLGESAHRHAPRSAGTLGSCVIGRRTVRTSEHLSNPKPVGRDAAELA